MRVLAVALLFASALIAQTDRGSITGDVSDPAGAVVPNAPIQAKNTETGAVFDTLSSSTGNYTLSQLPPGTYELSAAVSGFKKYSHPGLVVQATIVMRIDILLVVGQATESVTVTGEASLLNTETSELSHNIGLNTMDSLPILGIGSGQAGSQGIRNANAVLLLIPGTYYSPNAEVRINGTPDNTQAYRIDGMDASNSGTPGVAGQNAPSVDSIEELTVQTSNYAAEYGLVGGGMFNLVMKSGTNRFHGSAYDNFVNEDLNAAEPFFTGQPNVRPRNRRNDYGFTIGGPVWLPKIYNGHNKTFFFFNFEQYREKVTVSNTQTVPTTAYRGGNFATAIPQAPSVPKNIGVDPLGNTMLEGMIYDPLTTTTVNGKQVRTQFQNNAIPVTRFDPVAVKIQNLIPMPQGANSSSLVNNFINVYPSGRVTTVPSVKGDQQIGAKGKLSFYWSRNRTANVPPGPPFGANDGMPDPIITALGTFTNTSTERLNYDYTVTPSFLLHLGGGYQQVNFDVPNVNAAGALPNYNACQQVGLCGATVNTAFPAISSMVAGNGTGGMVGMGGSGNTENITERPSFVVSVTKVKSNHTFKAGAELQIHGYPAINTGGTAGSYTINQATTGQPFQTTTVNGANVGFAYASFLLGQVSTMGISNPTEPRLGKHQEGYYIQDSWKITHKLTFDYGLRYDYSTYLKEQYGRAPFFSATAIQPEAGLPGGTIYEGTCHCDVAHNYPFAFGPRLGLAYQINSKTVARVGAGLVYDGTESNNNASSGLAGSTVSIASPTFGFPITTLSQGIPKSVDPAPWPTYSPTQYPTGFPTPGASAPLVDQNAGRPGRQFQYSVGVQREIFRSTAVEASYVGNRGAWWDSPGMLNTNAVTSQILAAHGLSATNPQDQTILTSLLNSPTAIQNGFGGAPYPGFPLTQTVAQSLRPYPQYTNVATYWDPLGKTWYDALQMKATQRLRHGLSLVSTFTWSKTLTLGAERDPNPGSTGNAVFNNVFNRNNNKYLSIYDQPFQFNISANYTTPRANWGNSFGGKSASWFARDWTFGVFLKYSSGLPLEVPVESNTTPTLGALYLGQTTFDDRVPGQPLFLQNLNCHCFDPQKTLVLNPAAWVEPPPGQWGTSAAYYNDYRAQRHPVENVNFGRTFRIKERASLNIRAEFTNIFNRAVLNNPNSSNIKATIATNQYGNYTSGFGSYTSLTTSIGGAGVAGIINNAPRNGMIVARITF
jgi:hypothetical protein